jgi:hypothetical protein
VIRAPRERAVDKVVRESACWPTPAQELLLRAALGDRAEAVPAWERFFNENGVDGLPEGTSGLLPQVYRNLAEHGYRDPLMSRLKAIYRESWSKNQLLFHTMGPVVRSLHIEGIPTMLLNGVALSLAIYQDRGARPMRDFDLLVPANEADRALEHFAKQGWRSVAGHAMRVTPAQQRYRHAIELVSPAGQPLDLHWHLLYHSRTDQADAEFWKNAWPLYLGDDRSQGLPHTYQLLHTCAHGIEGYNVSPIHWICDAMLTIRAGKIEWDLLAELARRHDIVLPLRDALRFLQDTFHAPVPRSTVWSLEKEPVSRFAVMEYHRRLQPHAMHSPLVTVVAAYRGYQRGVRDWPLLRRLGGFPNYLADRFQLPSAGYLPRHFADWLAQRLRASGTAVPS